MHFFHSFICSVGMTSRSFENLLRGGSTKASPLLPVSWCLWFWRVLKDKQTLTILASKTNKATWSCALEWDFSCNLDSTGWKSQLRQRGRGSAPGPGLLLQSPAPRGTECLPRPLNSIPNIFNTFSLLSTLSFLLTLFPRCSQP